LDEINKLGLKRSGYRADHDHIKKLSLNLKRDILNYINLSDVINEQKAIMEDQLPEQQDMIQRAEQLLDSTSEPDFGVSMRVMDVLLG
jgi:hypothetical protein